jgi:AcrR family transcriptional regulator
MPNALEAHEGTLRTADMHGKTVQLPNPDTRRALRTAQLCNSEAVVRLTRASDIPTSVDNPELVAQRRREIVHAAVPLFVKHGFAATRMRDVAGSLNINIATIYQYIRTKEDILVLIYEEFYAEFCRFLAPERSHDSHLNAMRDLFYEYIALCERYRHYLLVFYRETRYFSSDLRQDVRASEQRNTDSFETLLVAGVEAGEFGCTEPEFVAHMIVGLGQQWIFKRWVLSEPFGLRGYADRAWDMIKRVLEPKPASDTARTGDLPGTVPDPGDGHARARPRRARTTPAGAAQPTGNSAR